MEKLEVQNPFWISWGADTTETHKLYGADNNSQISGVTVTAK